MRAWQGIAGAVAGTAAAGVAAGVAVERYAVNRLRGQMDPEIVSGFHASRGQRLTVPADDGVPLHVEIDGDTGSELTIIFCHGWTLERASWHYQRRELGDLGRLVFWDQRGHGRSGRGAEENTTIDQLGEDLRAVVDAVTSRGPIILVGHSMGGMTIMALAERCPQLFRDRVAGVALIATSAGGLGQAMPGVYGTAMRRVVPPILGALGRTGGPVDYVRGMSKMISHISTRRLSFGADDVGPEVVAFIDGMISATPVDIVAEFYPAILAHDKQAALDVFRRVPTTVIAGTEDRLIPVESSRAIAHAVPGAELVEAPGAGHMVMLGRPDMVNDALRALIDKVRAKAETAATTETERMA